MTEIKTDLLSLWHVPQVSFTEKFEEQSSSMKKLWSSSEWEDYCYCYYVRPNVFLLHIALWNITLYNALYKFWVFALMSLYSSRNFSSFVFSLLCILHFVSSFSGVGHLPWWTVQVHWITGMCFHGESLWLFHQLWRWIRWRVLLLVTILLSQCMFNSNSLMTSDWDYVFLCNNIWKIK